MYLLSTTNTPSMLIRNASRRDALVGVVDDYLIRYTRGIVKTNKRPQAPKGTKGKSEKDLETYWDKKIVAR